jgi:hypothetical protein
VVNAVGAGLVVQDAARAAHKCTTTTTTMSRETVACRADLGDHTFTPNPDSSHPHVLGQQRIRVNAHGDGAAEQSQRTGTRTTNAHSSEPTSTPVSLQRTRACPHPSGSAHHSPARVDLSHVVALAGDGTVLGDLVLLVRLLGEAALAGHAVAARVDGAARVVHCLVRLASVVGDAAYTATATATADSRNCTARTLG